MKFAVRVIIVKGYDNWWKSMIEQRFERWNDYSCLFDLIKEGCFR